MRWVLETNRLVPEIGMVISPSLPHFACRRCARCCTGKIVPVYRQDLQRLSGLEHCLVKTSKLEKEITGAEYKMRIVGGRCIFLKGNSCTHYDLRPNTCRRHPFIVTKRRLLTSATCPGVDWSSRLEEGRILENLRELSLEISERLDQFLDSLGFNSRSSQP